MTRATNGDTANTQSTHRIGEIIEQFLAEAITGAGCLDRFGIPETDIQLRRRDLLAERAARRLLYVQR